MDKILNIEPVSLSGMRFLFSFYGLSETGKTLSALLVAAGLEPDPHKRMLLDTEGGQRGRAYVNEIAGGYLYASLSPPYTPERYMQALGEIEAAGVTVLVTDSASHAWFAEGGVLQMVEESNVRNDMAKWKDPKRRLGKMMQRYRSSDMHHILCSRAKQPLIEGRDDQGKKIYLPGPVVPIQEKMMRYDMTVVAQMTGRGRFTLEAPQGKCPDNLLPIFTASELMNEDTGRRLTEWINVRNQLSPEARALRVQATEIAAQGMGAYSEFWRNLGRSGQEILLSEHGNLKSIAAAADDERSRLDDERETEEQAERERNSPTLDAPFGDRGIEFAGDPKAEKEDAFGLRPIEVEHAAQRGRSALWQDASYRIEPTRDLAGDINWDKWSADLTFLIGEATEAEVAKLKADNDDLLKIARKEHGDAFRSVNDAVASRRSYLAGDAAA